MIDAKDRAILREVAKQQHECAVSPEMEELRRLWEKHGAFEQERPMITIELDTFRDEIIPPLLRCEGEEARGIEASLYANFVNHTLFGDDFVVDDFYGVSPQCWFKPFDLDLHVTHADLGVGHHFDPVISDLHEDFHKLKKSSFHVDMEGTRKRIDYLNGLFGDILPVRLKGGALVSCLTQDVVHLMGMENMFFAMYDYPDEFQQMMNMLADDYLAYFDYLSKNGAILPTCSSEWLGNGSKCFTDELQEKSGVLTSKDVWGFMDSQETVGVSKDMFAEFIFPAYQKVAGQFGLLSYGCCEPVDPVWEPCLSKLPNLRKLSISPWCNEEIMGEQLSGKRVVYFRKPSPNFLGVGTTLDEAAAAEHIDKTVQAAKGCTLEIAQRDVYTVSNSPEKVRRYVEIIRQSCEKGIG